MNNSCHNTTFAVFDAAIKGTTESQKDRLIKFLSDFERFSERRRELSEIRERVNIEFRQGHLSEDYALGRIREISLERSRNDFDETRTEYLAFREVFGAEKAEELIVELFYGAERKEGPCSKEYFDERRKQLRAIMENRTFEQYTHQTKSEEGK